MWEQETKCGIAVARFNNPPMDYMVREGLEELAALIDTWEDESIKVVVLTGANEGRFITHYSVEELLAGQERLVESGPELNYRVHELFTRITRTPKVVIAAMNGDTMGVGFELCLNCDLRIAQRGDFRIGLPEVRLGTIPGGTGLSRLTRLVGRARALDLILRSRVLTPEEALEYGLVTELVDHALEDAMRIASEIATLPPVPVAVAKRLIYETADLPIEVALRMEADGSFRSKLSPESTPAMREYVSLPFEQRRAWLDAGRVR